MTQHKQGQQNEPSEKNKRWLLVLLAIAVFVGVVGVLILIFYLLPSANAVFNLNHFLFTHYGAFLALRLGIYGVMSLIVLRIKKRVIGTSYYRSYCRTCALCGVMVVLNEVMLLVRVMGA